MKHFLSTGDWSASQLNEFLEAAKAAKNGSAAGRLDGKTLGMLFFNPSLRTRTSFEVGMFQLGGHAVNLTVGQGMWNLESETGAVMDGDRAEHVKEAAGVLSRYVDALAVRAFAEGKDWGKDKADRVIRSFAENATVPVINMESSVWHPCQALADALTWREQGLKAGDPIAIVWTWHPKALPMAVPNSALLAAAQCGLDVTVIRPREFALDADIMKQASEAAEETGGRVGVSSDPAALQGVRVVYAKSWGSLQAYGDSKREGAIRSNYRDWQVTRAWMDRTDRGKFMHCLPVRRNVVVADEVLDGAASIVLEQAENRLHVQKTLLLQLLSSSSPPSRRGARTRTSA